MLNSAPDRGHGPLEFGPFRLEADERRLSRGGEPVSLPPKVFDLLAALVRRSGRLMTKDELMQEVWPDTYVDEANLTQTVFTLRRAIGDGESGVRYIETVPKRGYRFVAPVRVARAAAPALTLLPSAPPPAAATAAPTATTIVAAAPPAARFTGRYAVAGSVLLVALLVAGWFAWRAMPLRPPPFEQITVRSLTMTGDVLDAAMSPDGRFVAYVRSDQGLWLHQVATNNTVQIAIDGTFASPTFSADGEHLYLLKMAGAGAGGLFRIATLGGAAQHVIDGVASPVAVSPDGLRIAFVRWRPDQGIRELIVAGAGGEGPRTVLTRQNPHVIMYQGAAWSPDGTRVAVMTNDSFGGQAPELVAVDVATGESRTVTRALPWNAGTVVWHPDGSLIVGAGALWSVSFPAGATAQLTHEAGSYSHLALTRDGKTLMALKRAETSALWLAPKGDVERATRILSEAGYNHGIAWLRDGRLAYERMVDSRVDLWTTSRDGRKTAALVADSMTDNFPATASGDAIVYASTREGGSTIWWRTLDGRQERRLSEAGAHYAPDVSPDGQTAIYHRADPVQSWAIWRVSIVGGAPVRMTTRPATFAVYSPDGRSIACNYLVEGAAAWRIAILPASGGAPTRLLDIPGPPTRRLGWSPDGSRVLFSAVDDGLWSVEVDGGVPAPLARFEGERVTAFRWSPDGATLAYVRHLRRDDVVAITSRPAPQ